MTEKWTCERVDDVSAELALGLLAGNDRGAALEHIETCDRCRRILAANAAVVDRLLMVGPRADPSAGFEGRVLDAIRATTPDATPHVGRRRAVALASAAILIFALTIAFVFVANGDSKPPTRVADMIAVNGKTVGKVELGRSPSTVLVAIPGWYEPISQGKAVRMKIWTRDGKSLTIDPFHFDATGTGSSVLPVDPSEVRSVAVTDLRGRTLCHATLPRS